MNSLTCEVCGGAAATVRQSLLPLPASAAYCKRCTEHLLEPLNFVESYLADSGSTSIIQDPAYDGPRNAEEVVRRSLLFHASQHR